MGLRAIAVFSEADASARHVRRRMKRSSSVRRPAREGFLDIERILTAAKTSGAEAIHPGYGFLSEKAEFAEACAEAGLIFEDRPHPPFAPMGSKSTAKALMEQAGVSSCRAIMARRRTWARSPARPGSLDIRFFSRRWGGRGGAARACALSAGQTAGTAAAGARREAGAAFGDDSLLMEKYVERPRLRGQVFGDAQARSRRCSSANAPCSAVTRR